MKGSPFDFQGKGLLQVVESKEEEGRVIWSNCSRKRKTSEILEPRSVLDQRSPSPPTSTSTVSSSLGGAAGSTDKAGVVVVLENPATAAGEAHDFGSLALDFGGLAGGGEKCGTAAEDWEVMLSDSAAYLGQEQTFLHWIMGDMEDSSPPSKQQDPLLSSQPSLLEFDSGTFGLVDPGFGFDSFGGIVGCPPVSVPASAIDGDFYSSDALSLVSSKTCKQNPSTLLIQPGPLPPAVSSSVFSPPAANLVSLPSPLAASTFFHERTEEKPYLFNPILNQHQQTHVPPNPSFFVPLSSFSAPPEVPQTPNLLLPPLPKRHHSISLDHGLFSGQPVPYHLQQGPMKPKVLAVGDEAAMAVQHQALVDQLFRAAELVEAGNFIGAHGILARLNHQLPSPLGNPLLRSAFYFKEALKLLANSITPQATAPSPSSISPLDVVLKLSAYKSFSDVSPLLQFTNFTATQALLEELGDANSIHIIDFDMGIGGQWSSFLHELAHRRSPAIPLLKITALVSPPAFHPHELLLARDNLTHFAADLNIPFEINILNIESFDPAVVILNETIAVNLPIGASLGLSLPTLLRLVKQLEPKIVLSVGYAFDWCELSFSHHFLHAFQSFTILLDSIDAVGTNLDVANKIEKFVLQPKIENCVISRHCTGEKMMPWANLFESTGFVPFQFSNFTETQAECLMKRMQVRGFHVEKRQASLYLYWQRGELASISAWKCRRASSSIAG
ncbi:Scarecrow-like protein 6 [Apostasia shenzhenica]|uniref:Scarecrow-like protein 6 n=1 Tax=Apostasia shenzhenica TaxID=1088818 RepID=A0A2I0AVK1_9ASPA|nr:Scarecrow-like protein 6 [Apostasia shenzhenica]